MATVLFVHGTGVRQPAYDVAYERFREQLAAVRPGYPVARCYWGGEHGSRLNAGGLSIPAGYSARGLDRDSPTVPVGVVADHEAEVALWGLLERDPLFELRLLPRNDTATDERPPNAPPPGRQLTVTARQLPSDEAIALLLDAAGLGSVFAQAVAGVLDSDPGREALQLEPNVGGLRMALARAFTVEAMLRADEELGELLPLDGARRDELVAALVARLGGSDRGLGARLGRVGVAVALRLGVTRPVERRRAAITQASAPAAGDVLMYLARGEPIRRFIAEAVAEIEGPVVVVAHSLGGVASLELLVSQPTPQVQLLLTVGSQGPFLYELDALPTLTFGSALPETVPRWVNVFDRRDLLAYTGSDVFPGRVEDREIDNRAPFPRSHSAYFGNAAFYRLLDEVLP